MDDPNEENIEHNWVMVTPVDLAEEATTLDFNSSQEENHTEKNHDSLDSDVESDGISIISESSHLHEGSNDDENILIESIENQVNIEQHGSSKFNAADSSSETKPSWTFVDSEADIPEMTSSNQFYLNCLQEPVQELSEHELGSVQSDLESDGFSIISDCDSLYDATEYDEKLNKEAGGPINEELASKFHSGIKKYCNGVLIGTILLATSSIFLGHYFNSDQMEEDRPEFTKELTEKVTDEISDFKGTYEVPTALTYCQERHKTDDILMEHNVNKCLKKIEKRIRRKKENMVKEEEVKKLEKYLKIKEKFLEEKEKFLIKREYELLRAEGKLNKRRYKKPKEKKLKDPNDTTKNADANQAEAFEVLKRKLKNKNSKEKMSKNFKDKLKHAFKNLHKKKKEFNDYKDNDYKSKYKKETISNPELNKDNGNKRILKNKLIDDQTSKENNFLNKAKSNNNFHSTSSKEDKSDKTKERRLKRSTNYIVLGNTSDNQTINGYWVGKLYKGRSDLRNKRHSGDWYFDRASYRKTRRDKAKWYFDWMMDRELLRYKRTFYM